LFSFDFELKRNPKNLELYSITIMFERKWKLKTKKLDHKNLTSSLTDFNSFSCLVSLKRSNVGKNNKQDMTDVMILHFYQQSVG